MSGKTPCGISLADFLASARPVELRCDELTMRALPREFSTGSFGWYASGKSTITIDGRPLAVQASVTLTVVGSKVARRSLEEGSGRPVPPPTAEAADEPSPVPAILVPEARPGL